MAESRRAPTCLHLVVSASAEAAGRCRMLSRKGDTTVFMDDGVMALTDLLARPEQWKDRAALFSSADLDARGLLEAARRAGAHLLDDRDLVALLRGHDHCLTWK